MCTSGDAMAGLNIVTLTSEEYFDLLDAKRMLDALREAGVDNWEGYDHAMQIFNGENDEDF